MTQTSQQTFVFMKTSWRRFEDVFRLRLQDVLIKANMFALVLRLQKTSSSRLGQDQYIRLGYTSSRRLWEAFNTFLRRSFPNTVIYSRGICLGNTTSDRFIVSVQNLQEIKISQVWSFSLFYTFSWLLREPHLEPARTSTVRWRFSAEIRNFLGLLIMVLWEISQNSQ